MSNRILITKKEFDSLKNKKNIVEISLYGFYKEPKNFNESISLEYDYCFFDSYFNHSLNQFLQKFDPGIHCVFGSMTYWEIDKKYFIRDEGEVLGDFKFPKIIPLAERGQKEFYSSDDEKIYKFNLLVKN